MLQTLSALAEPNRFRIVELLRDGPRAVNDIAAGLELYQVQVSKHLRVLKAAGVVEVQARAQQRLYALRAQPLRELHAWLEGYRQLWDDRFAQLDELFEELEKKEKSYGRKRKK
jgi:DNA-binding transcriptional ArsR family regulator